MEMNKKIKEILAGRLPAYDIGDLVPVVVAFALVAIIGAVVLLILQNFGTNPGIGNTCFGSNVISSSTGLCTNPVNALNVPATFFSAAYNGVGYGTSGINQIMQFLPLIALVVVAAVIIGTVVGAFVLGGGAKKEF